LLWWPGSVRPQQIECPESSPWATGRGRLRTGPPGRLVIVLVRGRPLRVGPSKVRPRLRAGCGPGPSWWEGSGGRRSSGPLLEGSSGRARSDLISAMPTHIAVWRSSRAAALQGDHQPVRRILDAGQHRSLPTRFGRREKGSDTAGAAPKGDGADRSSSTRRSCLARECACRSWLSATAEWNRLPVDGGSTGSWSRECAPPTYSGDQRRHGR